jgi:hypothetical protein
MTQNLVASMSREVFQTPRDDSSCAISDRKIVLPHRLTTSKLTRMTVAVALHDALHVLFFID